MVYEYLFFNIFVFLGPIIGLLLFRINLKPFLKDMIPSIIIPAFIFISWDFFATDVFWSFNERFITGFKIGKLPFEEMLFFFTVPFSCLSLYILFFHFAKTKLIKKIFLDILTAVLFLLGIYFFYSAKFYTSVIFIILSLVWFLDIYITKTKISLNYSYWFFIFVIMILTSVFNYYLTSRPVVIYDNNFNLGLRFLTIPVEDYFYSFSLISLNLIFYNFFASKKTKKIL
jgi:lycopene cyclase domain-containing protein